MENKKKVAIIGCGNFGTTIGKHITKNLKDSVYFNPTVNIYTRTSLLEYQGQSYDIIDTINKYHVNPKHLPSVILPPELKAVNLQELNRDKEFEADVIILCIPHQCIPDVIKKIKPKSTAIAINLCKGLIIEGGDKNILETPANYIMRTLKIPCSTMMGANIAQEISQGIISSSVIGYRNESEIILLKEIFKNDRFLIEFIEYNEAIEIYSAIKNVMSIAFGIVEGMIELKELEAHKDKPFKQIGKNTLALIFQKCVEEMYKFSKFMTGTDDCLLMLKSCGVGDLFVSCVSGRNYMSGKHITAFFYENLNKEETLFEYLEKVFKSHKLQGLETVKTLTHVLVERKQIDEFPIIKAVYEICFENANPLSLISLIKEE